LWNVLRGNMSLVGPRPTLPKQVARYGAFERKRLAVRPGLTGWAQIHGRNALPWPERIALDVWYVRHHSLWLDVRILFRTPRLLMQQSGVYGPGGKNLDYP
jgi:lipopolysaccharide/colanic/teichoic acid biosynthesis glycosyltransferase